MQRQLQKEMEEPRAGWNDTPSAAFSVDDLNRTLSDAEPSSPSATSLLGSAQTIYSGNSKTEKLRAHGVEENDGNRPKLTEDDNPRATGGKRIPSASFNVHGLNRALSDAGPPSPLVKKSLFTLDVEGLRNYLEEAPFNRVDRERGIAHLGAKDLRVLQLFYERNRSGRLLPHGKIEIKMVVFSGNDCLGSNIGQ